MDCRSAWWNVRITYVHRHRTSTGHRSRLVQICIDSPPAVHDQEVAFWRAATGWRWREGSHDEFAGKLYPPTGSSVQLLFQRLGSDDPATAVRAHIDLGADDVEAEATRLVELGAERLRARPRLDRASVIRSGWSSV